MKITYIEIARQIETPAPYTPDMTTTVGKLRHLRHVVERIPPGRFNMDMIMERSKCGTIGCMLGWAALDQHFNSLGLSLVNEEVNEDGFWVSLDGKYQGSYAQAASLVLGIANNDAAVLFTSDAQFGESLILTPAHGLARIDRMIEKYSA